MLLARRGMHVINPLPYQPAKIHCPPARDDVLSRGRLNDWLDRATAGRIALIVAEAGFGKTTLLADWARHTTRMTAWYRLESDDRDWLTFIRHLIASGRELDTEFASGTLGMLLSLGPGGPTRQDLITSLAREIADFGTRSEQGLTLIFDDYHLVDGSSETDPIVRALLDRTAPGFSVVISSRTAPGLPMGKLRARGGVDRLDGDDLCFDADETERLFRDAYRHPLQADVIADLFDRTEGWAALLTLVRASLDEPDGPDPRALVAQLSATSGDLYDFLAEEVLAGLPPDLQRFLTRVSVLTAVDLDSAMLVDDRPASEIAATIARCETLGLLTRPDRGTPHRFHPLVREFLVARLCEELGNETVLELHRALAVQLEQSNWLAAAWHYRAGGDVDSAVRVIDAAVPFIVASGEFDRAHPFLDGSCGSLRRPGALILRSRLELERGNFSRAADLARSASQEASGTPLAGVAMLNLSPVLTRHGFDEDLIGLISEALQGDLDNAQRMVAEASLALWSAQNEGNLATIGDQLRELAARQDQAGHRRYAGVTRVNLAVLLLWAGQPAEAAALATRAEADLATFLTGPERVAAAAARITARVQLGNVSEIDQFAELLAQATSPSARDEAAIEAARVLADYGHLDRATKAAEFVGDAAKAAGYLGAWAVVMGTLALRRGEVETALSFSQTARVATVQDAAGKYRAQLLRSRATLAAGLPADDDLSELARIGRAQNSHLLETEAELLRQLSQSGGADRTLLQLMPSETHIMSVLAEEVCRSVSRLGPDALSRVQTEAQLRPDRWRTALRQVFVSEPTAARLLGEIGNAEDAAILRRAAVSRKSLRAVAAAATRRLAPAVRIRDLGAVRVFMGDAPMQRNIRRKVVGLLCFVSSRPGMAATKDEALDAIWPDLGPDTATNSLHQTIYYLRRVFEPEFREGMSAGYVQFDGDVLSLDADLIDSDSRVCWRLIANARARETGALDALVAAYEGTYALDFAYEDWAATYRNNLHAAVLAVAEAGIRESTLGGDTERSIRLAQRMLEVDPAADAIELELLRAYKASGRNAAAAEQYAHYASYVRGELGVEPPAFADL